jgi:hypothetical protein
MTYYILHKDSELATWSANFIADVTSNAPAWGIAPGEVTDRQTDNDSFAAFQMQYHLLQIKTFNI